MAEKDFAAMSSLLSTWKPFSTGNQPDSSTNEIEDQPSNHLELLRTGKDSDLKIRCEGVEWNIHRSVLCPRSAYFTTICNSNFKEAQSSVIDLQDVDATAMERVLIYLYTSDYRGLLKSVAVTDGASTSQTTPSSSTLDSNLGSKDENDPASERPTGSALGNASDKQNTDSLVLHARVYALADRFDIPSLRILANKKFVGSVDSQPWPPSDFEAATLEVIHSTPSNDSLLRKTISNLCARHLDEMKHPDDESEHEKQPQQIDKKSWKKMLGEDTDFTWDVIEQMAELAEMHRSPSSTREVLYQKFLERLRIGDCECTCIPYYGNDYGYGEAVDDSQLYVEVDDSGPLPDYSIRCRGCCYEYDMKDGLDDETA